MHHILHFFCKVLRGEVTALKESTDDAKQSSAGIVVAATAPPPSSGLAVSDMSKAELAAKLVQYQQFMAKYIVESQLQKMKAVMAAEAATAAKYEGKLALLQASSSATDSSTPVNIVESSSDTKLYDTRNANVAAAGKAGKSRWGDMEVAKVQISSNDTKLNVKSQPEPSKMDVNGAVVNGSTTPSHISLSQSEPSKVDVNGAVVNGSTTPSQISLSSSDDLYSKRNARIAAAAAAGKSRWGSAESEKATEEASKPSLSSSTSSTPAVVAAEVEAADHGLRNDGGVGGPSLAERVNLGQQLFTGGSDAAVTTAPSSAPVLDVINSGVPSIYDIRNAKIAAAAAAGKSRWGVMENEKATSLASNILSSGSSSSGAVAVIEIPVSAEVEAADHGLRNDGGVGGPSLAERINAGSGMF